MLFQFVDLALELVFFHDPVGSLLFNCKDQSCSLLLSFLGLLFTVVKTKLEGLTLAIDLLLVLSDSTIALILDLLELESQLLFILLLFSESFLERSDLLVAVLGSICQALCDVMQLLLEALDLVL